MAVSGAALGLASLVVGCAPPVTALPAAAAPPKESDQPQAVALPNTEEVVSATGVQRVRPVGARERGKASYYGPEFTGRKMASGRRFDPRSTTVAHRTLPLGSTVLVTNLGNGRTTTATVEDRGPFVHGRIIDLSPRLAEYLGMKREGVAPVEVLPVEVAEAPDTDRDTPAR